MNSSEFIQLVERILVARGVRVIGAASEIAKLGVALARMWGCDKDQVRNIYIASMLLDCGKMLLPDHILHRPYSELSSQNKKVYQGHSVSGAALLNNIEELRPAARLIALQDRRNKVVEGSENGLPHEENISAQIVGMAAFYIAWASSMPARDISVFISFLKSFSGIRFSKTVVDLMLKLLSDTAIPPPIFQERKVNIDQLQAGMQLSRDLVTEGGALLLSKGQFLTQDSLRQLKIQIEEGSFTPIFVFGVNS